jgi:hypothetical protein
MTWIGKPPYPRTLVAKGFSEHWQTAAADNRLSAIVGACVGHRTLLAFTVQTPSPTIAGA